jgi:hypothetical protein
VENLSRRVEKIKVIKKKKKEKREKRKGNRRQGPWRESGRGALGRLSGVGERAGKDGREERERDDR